jgi:predicted phage terminase large subunit-like protein
MTVPVFTQSDLDAIASACATFPIADIERAATRALCEGSLLEFIRAHWHVVEPGRPFVDNWHLHALCEHLEAVTDGRISRVLFNVPPGAMKSLTVNVFWPAWEWGPRNMPYLRYLSASYSEDLTVRDNRRCRAIIGSELYQSLWADRVKIDPNQDATGNYATMAKGWRIATSVGGVGTGERADRIIVDDPHSVKTADSEIVRKATLLWWNEVMPTRLNDPATSAMIVIMQRVHEEDVAGSIISGEQPWAHVMVEMRFDPRLPHRKTLIGWQDPRTEDGELYWPERFPEWVVDRDERIMGPFAVAAQHQQSPSPRGGGILRLDWWRCWPEESEADSWTREVEDENGKVVLRTLFPDFEFILVSIDTAYTERQVNDWSACTVWGLFTDRVRRPRIMLVEAWRERLELHELVERVRATCTRRKADALLIEAKASGLSVIQEVRRLTREDEYQVIGIDPKGDKVARVHAIVPMFSGGLIFAPKRRWADVVMEECAQFPRGRHDDFVDATSQALGYMRRTGLAQLVGEVERDEEEALTFRGQRQTVATAYGL